MYSYRSVRFGHFGLLVLRRRGLLVSSKGCYRAFYRPSLVCKCVLSLSLIPLLDIDSAIEHSPSLAGRGKERNDTVTSLSKDPIPRQGVSVMLYQ